MPFVFVFYNLFSCPGAMLCARAQIFGAYENSTSHNPAVREYEAANSGLDVKPAKCAEAHLTCVGIGASSCRGKGR
jgi:hypothetical protein